jgi:hypothetical protein
VQIVLQRFVERLKGLRDDAVELEVPYALVDRLQSLAVAPEGRSANLLRIGILQP